MAKAINQSLTGSSFIDGLLSGTAWLGPITYSFPTSKSQYPAGYFSSPTVNFSPVSTQERAAVRAIMMGDSGAVRNVEKATSVDSFVVAKISATSGGAGDIRIAQSATANPTALAYYPSNEPHGSGGDVWFGTAYAGTIYDYRNPYLGGYAYHLHLHELGHALGLKNPHELTPDVVVRLPSANDAIEFSIMSYRNYVGDSVGGGYIYGRYDAPQTFMAFDIRALQTMYGADYGAEAHNTNTAYRWSPTTGEMSINGSPQGRPGANKVFLTIWDGGGTDTYDMSNFAGNVRINLNPGAWSITSSGQRAYLGNGHRAKGTVYNAFLFNDDPRSLIENAKGGKGNDILIGNNADNTLLGNSGADRLEGRIGNDRLDGGTGLDTLIGGPGNDVYILGASSDKVSDTSGVDAITTLISRSLVGYLSIENLVLIGAAAINGTGNGLANRLSGNSAANILNGEAGNDTIIGNGGNDQLVGGLGDDILYGGDGNDSFHFAALEGADTISDFGDIAGNEDTIVLPISLFADFAAVALAMTEGPSGVAIDTGGGGSITLVGVTLAQLDASDFSFV